MPRMKPTLEHLAREYHGATYGKLRLLKPVGYWKGKDIWTVQCECLRVEVRARRDLIYAYEKQGHIPMCRSCQDDATSGFHAERQATVRRNHAYPVYSQTMVR
jgi:hypothetical protein